MMNGMDQKELSELKYLQSFVACLESLRLINAEDMENLKTKVDRSHLKAEILELVKSKEATIGMQIYMLIRVWFKDERNSVVDNQTKALCLDKVIKCIFGFLSLNDLKNCRLTNKKWNSVAESLVRKRSKIIFRKEADVNNFHKAFQSSRTNIPFNSFRFNGDFFTISTLTDFFVKQKNNIKELDFNYSILVHNVDAKQDAIESYDISKWISESAITALCVKTYPAGGNRTSLTVSMNQLESVEKLHLTNCWIKISKGIKMSPKEISLHFVTFYHEGNKLNVINISDCCNLEKAKKIEINNDRYDIFAFALDENNNYGIDDVDISVASKANVIEEVVLTGPFITVNWATLRLNINNLKMEGVVFLEKTEAKFKNLTFAKSTINLNSLPMELETLVFLYNVRYVCAQPINLPNLKYLSFNFFRAENLDVTRHFIDCNNLTAVQFCGHYGEVDLINLDYLPRSVKKLCIAGIPFLIGREILNLDKLVLTDYCFLEVERILKKVKTKVLVLTWKKRFESIGAIFQFLNSGFCPETLYLGQFHWSKRNTFENSLLPKYVDKKSLYYVFENKKGRSIKESDFDNMSNISK